MFQEGQEEDGEMVSCRRAEQANKQHEEGGNQGRKAAACFMRVSCFAYSSTLKMEKICSSETSIDFQQNT
jgi:hypothetical protein